MQDATASTGHAPAVHTDNRLKAALGVCGGIGFFTLQDALVKYISGSYPIHEILVIRCLATLPMLAILLLFDGGFRALQVPRWGWLLARSFILFGAYCSNSLAIATISMADATAMYFALPLFVAWLAWPLLGERVPGYRWIAIIIGFVGVLIMVRPGTGAFEPAALLALLAGFLYGLGQMLARKLRDVASTAIAFHQNLVYLGCALALAAVFGSGHFAGFESKSVEFMVRGWVWPAERDLLIMLSFGVIGVIGLPLYIMGYKSAPANFSAAFEYTGMIWAVALGWLLFRDLPGWSTAAGAVVVIGAGLWMLWKDARA